MTATDVPPAAGPEIGLVPVTAGDPPLPAVYVKRAAALVALVPAGVVTVTSTVPVTAETGEVATIDVGVKDVMPALVLPNLTADAPVNPVPVMTTDVPPAVVPLPGLTPVTVGAAVGPPQVTTMGVELAWAFVMLAFEM